MNGLHLLFVDIGIDTFNASPISNLNRRHILPFCMAEGSCNSQSIRRILDRVIQTLEEPVPAEQ